MVAYLLRQRRRAVFLPTLLSAVLATSCGDGSEARFSKVQAGKVVEFFDPAKANIGFDPARQYVSAVAVGNDETLYVGIAQRREKDRWNVDAGRLFAVRRSGKPKVIGEGTVSALAVSSDGTLYIASTGSRRSSLSFFRDGRQRFIIEYADAFRSPAANSPGVNRILQGLAIAEKTGDIYVADSHKIDRIDRIGRLLTVSGARREEGEAKPPVAEGADLAGQQFDSINGIAYNPDRDMLDLADGNLRSILPNDPRSGVFITPLELPDGTYEGGLGRRGVAYDPKSKTLFGVAKTDDAIVMLGEGREPKTPVDKAVLEDVVRMTVGSDGNLYLSGASRVYVFAPPAS